VNIVLFGPPGAGKGTQADNLVKDFNLFKISTGDLLREEVEKGNKLGNKIKSLIDKGSFVSDNIIEDLVKNVISNKSYNSRLVFDGYPRNLNQAKKLDMLMKGNNQKISCVLNLIVNENTIFKRIIGRQICTNCKLIFNDFFNPPNNPQHKCDPKFLQKRSDDTEETLRKRFSTYNKSTLPILDYYDDQNLLTKIDGINKIDEIYKEIRQIISSLKT